MKRIAITILFLFLSSPLFAVSGPTVTLTTTALANPFPQSFQVNATFSEPVTGFGPIAIQVTNGTVLSVSGTDCQPNYVITIQPLASGDIDVFILANVVVSLSTGAPNQASNLLIIPGLTPPFPPSSNFNLQPWSLTLPLPLGSDGNAISIGQATLNGIPAENNGYSNPPYFFTDPVTGAMNFFAPLNGATTPGSAFSRSELYEILPGASPSWKLSTFSSNTLTASLLVSQVPPGVKKIVVAQIHDKGDTDSFGNRVSNSPFVMLYYDMNSLDPTKHPCNGCLYAQVRTTPAQSNFFKIVSLIQNVPLNKIFMYQLTLLRNGTLTIKVNTASTTIKVNTSTNNTIGWGAQNLYFKAGVYNLENGTSNTLGGAASFYTLVVKHT